MILVTGANGHLGSKTIDFLLDQVDADEVAGLVRSEEKGAELQEQGVELRIGDYRDFASIRKAVEGVDTLLLISSSTMEGRADQHENVIQAAEEAGVGQLFYTSMVQADRKLSPIAEDHMQTEQLLKDSDIPHSIFRHTFYTEFMPYFWGDAPDSGEWAFPSDGQKINLAYRSEMAEALANGLADPEEHKNEVYEITSSEAHTLEELADMLSEATGNDITYTDVSVPEFRSTLEDMGLPQDQLAMSVMTAKSFVNGALDFTYDHLEQLLGREPKGMQDFIEDYVKE